MEELNKTQIVLLAIFITLVTSVATGVIVVTLMDQAPQGVTQTINRVVERTVEKVVSPGKVEKTEVTQIIREDDNIIASIKKAKQSLVRIVRDTNVAVQDEQTVTQSSVDNQASIIDALQNIVSDTSVDASLNSAVNKLAQSSNERIGFIVSSDGLVVTSKDILSGLSTSYSVILYNDTRLPLTFLKSDDDRGIALFKIDTSGSKEKLTFVPLTARSYDQISLGQTVIAMGFDSGLNTVSMGYISGMRAGTASSSPIVKASIKPSDNWSGRPIIDTNGFLVGVYGSNNEIITFSEIKALIDSSATKEEAPTGKTN